jgi:hypothetical protein
MEVPGSAQRHAWRIPVARVVGCLWFTTLLITPSVTQRVNMFVLSVQAPVAHSIRVT